MFTESRRMRSLIAACVVSLVVSGVTACGDAASDRPTSDTSASPAGVPRASDQVECQTKVDRGRGNYDTGPEAVASDPDAALKEFLAQEGTWLPPEEEFRQVADNPHARTYAVKTGSRVTAAIVVGPGIQGPDDDRGWGVKTWATCDSSEWSGEITDALGFQIWTDRNGQRAPTYKIMSALGPEHCQWQSMTFLSLTRHGKATLYVGALTTDLEEYFKTTYDADATLPKGARDTGYSRDGKRLWVTPEAAYLVPTGRAGTVERWPAGELACA